MVLPIGIEGFLVILGFCRHLGQTDTFGLDPHAGIDPMPDKMKFRLKLCLL